MELEQYTPNLHTIVSSWQFRALMLGLSRCKTSFQNHVKEMGGVSKADVAAWCDALKEMSADDIDAAFSAHCKHKNYWPKFTDIVSPEGRCRKDRWEVSDTQSDLRFGFDDTGAVQISAPLTQPLMISGQKTRVVPSKMSDEQKQRFRNLMDSLQGDEIAQARRRNQEAKNVMKEERRLNGANRNPDYKPKRGVASLPRFGDVLQELQQPTQPETFKYREEAISHDELEDSEMLTHKTLTRKPAPEMK